MNYALILDSLVSVLLVTMIVYAALLNRRLGALRDNKTELMNLIASFNEATFRAEQSIQNLRRAASETGEAVQNRITEARGLRDDLAFMIERGGGLADKLERSVRSARSDAKPGLDANANSKPALRPDLGRMVSESARSDPGRGEMGRNEMSRGEPPRGKNAAPLDDMAEDDKDGRSLAERELLKALRSVR